MSKTTYPFGSFPFWKAYFVHCRPYLFFVSGAAGLSGMALAGKLDLTDGLFWMAFLPFFVSYGLGQALTDTFQVDTDRISAPYRPLSQGIVTPTAIFWTSLLGLFLCGLSIVSLNRWNILLAGVSIFGLATYSFSKKKYWFAGPPHNALIVSLLPLMGYLSVSGCAINVLIHKDLIQLATLSFFAYANFVMMGYLKDITADRETGYRTFPVVFGWDPTVWVGDVLALLSIVLATQLIDNSWEAILLLGAGSVVAIAGQLYAHLTLHKQESNARFPIEATVRSFILWQLAVVVGIDKYWLVPALLYYGAFELFLYMRPERSQI